MSREQALDWHLYVKCRECGQTHAFWQRGSIESAAYDAEDFVWDHTCIDDEEDEDE